MIRRRITDLAKHQEKRRQETAAIEAAAFMFIQAAESGRLAAADIAAHADIFPLWEENTPHSRGCLRRCPENKGVYRCTNPPSISPQARNSRIPPSEAPRFWERVGGTDCAEAKPCENTDGGDVL